MKKLFNKSFVALTMALILVMSMVSSAFAATFSDIDGHWANGVITKWANKEYAPGEYYAKGYPDGTFKPDNIVTRAEFCAFANRYFGYFGYSKANDTTIVAPFSDVKVGAWYYHDVAVANEVGFCTGYGNGTFQPNKAMSREEVAYALGKLFGENLIIEVGGVVGTIDNTVNTALGLVSLDGVVPDLKPIVAGLLNLGIIKGVLTSVGELIFAPQKAVTRAEIVQIMDNIFIQFPEFLNNGNLLVTVMGIVGPIAGEVLGVTGDILGVVDAVVGGVLGGTIGSDGTGLGGVLGGLGLGGLGL